ETATPEPEAITEEPIVSETPEPTEIVVDIVPTEETDAVILSNPVTLYVNATGAVRVRNAPSLTSDIIARISPNDSVIQLGTSDDGQWIQVELETGVQGWIAEFLLVDYPLEPTAGDGNPGTGPSSANANP